MLLDDGADETLGRHPWDSRHPIVLDMTAAIDLGYTPVGDYATTVANEVEWLVSAAELSVTGSRLRHGAPSTASCAHLSSPALHSADSPSNQFPTSHRRSPET